MESKVCCAVFGLVHSRSRRDFCFPLIVFIAVLISGCSDQSPTGNGAQDGGRDFKNTRQPNGNLDKLYVQPLEYPYSNTWYSRLDKSNAAWRDVLLVAEGKMPSEGILSFRCDDYRPDVSDVVAWVPINDGVGESNAMVKFEGVEIDNWKNSDYSIPPYETYIAAKAFFC